MGRFDEFLNIFRVKEYDGYKINYSKPFHEPCPTHGCTTYETDEPGFCYCPQCGRILIHH